MEWKSCGHPLHGLGQWFSTFHGLWPPSPFYWRIINIFTLAFRNITAELISKSLCSWPPENRSMTPNGARRPRLRNPGLGLWREWLIFVSTWRPTWKKRLPAQIGWMPRTLVGTLHFRRRFQTRCDDAQHVVWSKLKLLGVGVSKAMQEQRVQQRCRPMSGLQGRDSGVASWASQMT